MSETEKEIEKKYDHNREDLVRFLREFTRQVENGVITIENENVTIPDDGMETEYGFKIEDRQSEIEIEIKWK